ncbi:MAG: hypothetical protein GF329_07810 [Candidatus Lokiarchaeota archaeon]|nr:hypothetical protein [Candidatus Lokiarchaeota archaeon]
MNIQNLIKMEITEISLGNLCIEKLLNGGFKSGKFYHIFGKDGSGKTTICLQLATLVAKNGYKSLYIDTSHKFNIIRLKQISGDIYEKISKLIFVQTPKNFIKQDKIVNKLENYITDRFKFIVIDDIASLSREGTRFRSKPFLVKRMVSRQLAILKYIGNSHNLIVLITNQSSTYTDENTKNRKTHPYLQSATTFYSDYDLEIRIPSSSKLSDRKMIKIKPSDKSTDRICKFKLKNNGIE